MCMHHIRLGVRDDEMEMFNESGIVNSVTEEVTVSGGGVLFQK